MDHRQLPTASMQVLKKTFDYESAAKFLQTRWNLAMIEVEEEECREEEERREKEECRMEEEKREMSKNLLAMLAKPEKRAHHSECVMQAPEEPQTAVPALSTSCNYAPAPAPQDDQSLNISAVTAQNLTAAAEHQDPKEPISDTEPIQYGTFLRDCEPLPSAFAVNLGSTAANDKGVSRKPHAKGVAREAKKPIDPDNKDVNESTFAVKGPSRSKHRKSSNRRISTSAKEFPPLASATPLVNVSPAVTASFGQQGSSMVTKNMQRNYLGAVLNQETPTVVTTARQRHQTASTTKQKIPTMVTEGSQGRQKNASSSHGMPAMLARNGHSQHAHVVANHAVPGMMTESGQVPYVHVIPDYGPVVVMANAQHHYVNAIPQPGYYVMTANNVQLQHMGAVQSHQGVSAVVTDNGQYHHVNSVSNHGLSTMGASNRQP